jgi:hypothetical protein
LIEVAETLGGRTYRLPPRDLGPARVLAIVPFGLAVLGFVFIVNEYFKRAAQGQAPEWALIVAALLGAVWARIAYTLVSFAGAVWCGRNMIEVSDDGAVRALDRTGWFRIRWGRLAPGTVRRFLLKPFLPMKDASGKPMPVTLWQLNAETESGRQVWLAPGHAREVVEALADLLAKQLVLAVPEPDPTAAAVPLPAAVPAPIPVVVEEPEIPNRDVIDQPPKSRVGLERHPDGVTITVPALGVAGANGVLLFMGGLFGLVGGVVTIGFIVSLLQPNPKFNPGMIVCVVFFFVGGGLFLTGLQSALKKCVLAVVGDRLLTFETGPLGSKRREFARADLLDIACGPSQVSVNKKPLPQLQIVANDKTHIGILTGRDETELQWLATVLRQALGIPSEAPEYRKAKPGTADKPWAHHQHRS